MKFPKSIIQKIFILTLSVVFSLCAFSSIKKIFQMKKIRNHIPFSFGGYQFSELQKLFSGIEYVGYYTDKDIKNPQNNMFYSQAQFVLAPTILDINNTTHKYTFFDCSSEKAAFEKIQALGLKPLKRSKQGIILARK